MIITTLLLRLLLIIIIIIVLEESEEKLPGSWAYHPSAALCIAPDSMVLLIVAMVIWAKICVSTRTRPVHWACVSLFQCQPMSTVKALWRFPAAAFLRALSHHSLFCPLETDRSSFAWWSPRSTVYDFCIVNLLCFSVLCVLSETEWTIQCWLLPTLKAVYNGFFKVNLPPCCTLRSQ